MPWTENDVEKHNKGLSDHEKSIWVEVANKSLANGDDDGTAIKKANGVIKHNRIVAHTESLLYKKANQLIDVVRLQEIAALFEAPLDNEPEGILNRNGWKPVSQYGDTTHYTHSNKVGHEIHLSRNGGWRHYDKDGKAIQAGFTGERLKKHLG